MKVADKAKESGVIIRRHNVIYRLFEDLKAALKSQLPPLYEDSILGRNVVDFLSVFVFWEKGFPYTGFIIFNSLCIKHATINVLVLIC